MGICSPCKHQGENQQIKQQVLHFKVENCKDFNNILLQVTNKSISNLSGDCLIFYADKKYQLETNKYLRKIDMSVRRQILDNIGASEQLNKNKDKNKQNIQLISISIPKLRFKYILLIKMNPWDGNSKRQLQKQIEELTKMGLQSLKSQSNLISKITIVEFDQYSGVHYSMSCKRLLEQVKEFSEQFDNITFLCNTVESVRQFHRQLNKYSPVYHPSQKSILQNQNKNKNSFSTQSKDSSVYF